MLSDNVFLPAPADLWNSFYLRSENQILVIDKNGIILDTNYIHQGLIRASALIGKCAFDFISEVSKETYINTVKRIFETGKSETIELMGHGPDSRIYWYKSILFPSVKDNMVNSVIVLINNITAKKELEERYQKFSIASTEGIVVLEKHLIKEVNGAAMKILGYEEQELIGKVAAELIYQEDYKNIIEATEFKPENTYEVRVVTKSGTTIECEVKAQTINYKGHSARVITFKDISKRRKAEQLARLNEERFRRLSEASFETVLIHEAGKIVDFNQTCVNMFGYLAEELLTMEAFDLGIEEEKEFLQQQVRLGVETPYEAVGKRKDGSFFFAEINAKQLNYNGKITRVVSIRDISLRKEYEHKLKQVKEDYENLIRQSPDGVFILDKKGKILFANPSAHRIVGLHSEEEIKDKTIFSFTLPNHHKQIRESAFLLRAGYDLPFVKINAIRTDGTSVEVEYKPVQIDYQGKECVLVVYHDIDFQEQLNREKNRYRISEETNKALKKEIEHRKKIEDKLQLSKEEYKEQSARVNSIIESSSHIVWTVNKKIELTSFNENFARHIKSVYGIRPSKMDSLNKGKFVYNREYFSFLNDKFKIAFVGKSQHFETNIKDRKKESIWLEIFLNPIFDLQGDVQEVSGIAHDITEKKLAEDRIKQSLKEKEVLLQEVHHRVKNNLQVISSILNLQSSYVSDKKTIDLLKESQNRIKSMSFIHESLYQTKDFTSVNFPEYVNNIANNLLLSYVPKGKKINLKQEIDAVFLNLDLAIPCGLIINEILSNALKYAFGKSKRGELSISIKADRKENVKMVIADNGVGLPPWIGLPEYPKPGPSTGCSFGKSNQRKDCLQVRKRS